MRQIEPEDTHKQFYFLWSESCGIHPESLVALYAMERTPKVQYSAIFEICR